VADMSGPVRWGVLGATSLIYTAALRDAFAACDDAEVVATASRSGSGHASTAPTRYGDYAALIADPAVEAVYIPLPNALHEPWTLAAAEAGKHVLCEKPLAPDAAGARRMADACANAGVTLFEAYMTPFHPRSARWERMVSDGWVGRPLHGTARFTFPHPDPSDHRWRADAGGGALLDVGIYCLEPLLRAGGWRPGDELPDASARETVAGSGVDATFTGWLSFASGFTAALCCSFDAPEAQTLEVVGTEGSLRVTRAFTPGVDDRTITGVRRDGVTVALTGTGDAMYRSMIAHVTEVIRGRQPSRRPPDASVALAEVIDHLKAAARSSPHATGSEQPSEAAT
jgi:xylose dehydrogenase (NAD/NADP)